jgi:hypothetical protein
MADLRIPIKTAELAISAGSHEFECFAFAVLVKLTYGSSCIHNATVRRCKALFGIGSTKMSRILRHGVENGYLRREGNNIIANPLEVEKKGIMALYNMPLRNVGKIKNHKCQYTLRDVQNRLRQIVLINLVRLNRSIQDAEIVVKDARTISQYRRSVKLLKRVPETKESVLQGLSAQRAAENMHVSKSKARQLIADVVERGLLTRKDDSARIMKITDDGWRFDTIMYNKDDYGLPGYLFRWGNYLYLRKPPMYSVTDICQYRFNRDEARTRHKQYLSGYTFGVGSFGELEKAFDFKIPEF